MTWDVIAEVTVFVKTTVEAATKEEAEEIVRDMYECKSLFEYTSTGGIEPNCDVEIQGDNSEDADWEIELSWDNSF